MKLLRLMSMFSYIYFRYIYLFVYSRWIRYDYVKHRCWFWIGLSGVEHCQQNAQQCQRGCGCGNMFSSSIVRLATGWRADRYDRLEQIDARLGIAKTVCRLAHIIAILPLLDRYDAQRRVGVLIGGGEVRDCVMLIVGQLDVILGPYNGWWGVRFDVALEIHVVLQSLAEAWSGHSYDRCEFNLHVDVATITFADAVVGNAVVGATIFLLHGFDAQNVANISGAVCNAREEEREASLIKGSQERE